MSKKIALLKKIAIATHPYQKEAEELATDMTEFFREKHIEVSVYHSIYDDSLRRLVQQDQYQLLIAVGGDGTMLRAGHLCAPIGLPILGVNLGRFGFLTEVEPEQWRQRIQQIFEGEYWLEDHMTLRVEHRRGAVNRQATDPADDEDELLGVHTVLNEVVVCRGQYVRPIHLEADVDGYKLSSYIADGLIASTPTGSTAYALAVGGPIMPPELRNILIIPVAPHLSVDRAIILSEGARVTITAYTDHQAVLSADGQPAIVMQNGDYVVVESGEHVVTFVRFHDRGYFYRNLTMHMDQNPSAKGDRKAG